MKEEAKKREEYKQMLKRKAMEK